MKETFLLEEKDLPGLAEKVKSLLLDISKDTAIVILLDGDLGAGKTTFTKALAETLGIENSDVHSPTFILKKEYKASHPRIKRLVHVDAYRFTHPDESKVLQLEEDLKDKETLVVVEWPSKMKYIDSDIRLDFTVTDDLKRTITLTT